MFKMYQSSFLKTLIIGLYLIFFSIHSIHATDDVKEIDVKELEEFFSDQKATKVIFLFTSWCKHCKIGYLKLQEIAKNHDSSKLKVLAISMDEDKKSLSKFLKSHNTNFANINVYHTSNPLKIISEMQKVELKYKGSIPHVAVFKKNNKIAIDGQFNGEYLSALIECLINP